MRKTLIALASVVLFAPAWGLAADVQPLSESEATLWIRHTVPLPKEIALTGQVTVPAGRIAIETKGSSDALVAQAVRELQAALGGSQTQPAEDPQFTILLEVGGETAAGLETLKNADQAYRIEPLPSRDGLRVSALTARGVYYGAKTLKQLIQARSAAGKVVLPLATVTDWPDMATRGLWGADAYRHVPWLSDRKYNHMEQIATSRVKSDGQATVGLSSSKQQMVDEGPTYGINAVPAIVHLEHMHSSGVFEAYPELKGKGEGVHPGAACYSNPKIVDILADWIIGYAKMKGVHEVDLWLSENLARKPGCQCEKCRPGNRDLLEVGAVIDAWKRAKERYPDLKFWVLTSEETADSNVEILKLLPKEINLWYYDSLGTYNTNSAPMVPGYLREAALGGRHCGVCLNLSSTVFHPQPFTGADFVHARMNEFVAKDLPAFMGYPTPGIAFTAFNTEAAAEWSWNARGRSLGEFALSYAVRAGMKNPELFAEWSETMGPVAWDVYGSHWPTDEHRKSLTKVAEQVKTGKLPELGEILWNVYPKPWGDIKTVDQLNRGVEQAKRGVKLARQMGRPEYVAESLVVQGYLNSLKALWELKQLVTADGIAKKDQPAATRFFQMYVDGLNQARDQLPAWEETLATGRRRGARTGKTVELVEEMAAAMTQTARDLGVTMRNR